MLIGYGRVSTADQSLDLQLDALKDVGCQKIFQDVASGARSDRPGLDEAMAYLREGDTLVVWKLDRLGRSLKHLIEVLTRLNEEKKAFRSLQESLDTSTPTGKLIFHVFGALAEFERDLIRERTKAGLAAARARGRKGGRPRVMDDRKIAMARTLLADPDNRVVDVCDTLGICKATLYNYLKSRAVSKPEENAETEGEHHDSRKNP